jgi:hypothetical protein
MTTAIAVYNSSGVVGRCDAKCHEATPGTPCDCICGGRLHSASSAAVAEIASREWYSLLSSADAWAKARYIWGAKVKAPGMGRRRLLEPMLRPSKVRAEALRRDQVELAL